MKKYWAPFINLAHPRWVMYIVFPFIFLTANTILEALYSNVPEATLRSVYLDKLVKLSAMLINFMTPDAPVLAYQNDLISGYASLQVVSSCSGASLLFLLAAAILAFPASSKQKAVGLVLGLLFVFAVNLLRIIALYVVMAYQPHWFLPVHRYIAPALIIVLCCSFFAGWGFWTQAVRSD